MKQMRSFRIFEPILLIAAALVCQAQDRGTILGRVTDVSSAVIPGATITVTNQDTGVKSVTSTNEAGNYTVSGLPFGRYQVDCEAKGFRMLPLTESGRSATCF